MTLPFLLSVPHAGTRVPPEAERYCILTAQEVIEDGDVGASEIYALQAEARYFLTTDIARAIVDLNRAENDRRQDGVVKTHTCWNVAVYRPFPPEAVVKTLLERYYHPYHAQLRELTLSADVPLGIDCHTMAAHGPPVGPDPGVERPRVCLGNGDGTCPPEWMEALVRAFRDVFGRSVTVNEPFAGGYITRTYAKELPFIQIELSRAPFMTNADKRAAVLEALTHFGSELFPS